MECGKLFVTCPPKAEVVRSNRTGCTNKIKCLCLIYKPIKFHLSLEYPHYRCFYMVRKAGLGAMLSALSAGLGAAVS